MHLSHNDFLIKCMVLFKGKRSFPFDNLDVSVSHYDTNKWMYQGLSVIQGVYKKWSPFSASKLGQNSDLSTSA